MINYAGLCRIPFFNKEHKDIKIQEYKKGNKARYQAKAQWTILTHTRTKINIWDIARLNLTKILQILFHWVTHRLYQIKQLTWNIWTVSLLFDGM